MRRFFSRTPISFCLAVAILNMYTMVALAAPEQTGVRLAGSLSVFGQVTVDGQEMISGATFFSNGKIETAEDSTATVSLGKLGRVQYSPKSVSTLSFAETNTTGSLDAGRMQVLKPEGISASFITKDGSVVADGSEAAVFSIDVSGGKTLVSAVSGRVELRSGKESKMLDAGHNATMGQGGTTGSDDDGNQPGMDTLAVVLGGGFLAAVIIAALMDEEEEGGDPGTGPIIINPSPNR